MSKNVAMFIDVANLYYAARGQEVDVDYVALLKHATKGRDLIRAYAYSGLDPENENQRKFIDFLGKNGYRVLTKDIRKFGDGRVKANLDIELVVDLFRLRDRMDIAVIVSGDGDFAPAIRALQDEGVRCEVISFRPNTSSDLIAVADEFIDVMKIAGIGRKKGEGSRGEAMSMPEMPAKEVVPEFGFREASPSVAAAAIAAIKGGGAGSSRRAGGRGDGRRRGARTDAAGAGEQNGDVAGVNAAAPASEASTADRLAEGEEGRRRRRRRGGRGRGRGRGAADARVTGDEATPGELPAAIGWQEVDDLSQLEGLGEEREYTFEEADTETLRELGLLDGGTSAVAEQEDVHPEASAPEDVAPTRRGGRRRAASSEQPVAQPADETGDSTAPARRRRTARRPATAEGEETAESKPRRARRPRTAAAGDADAPASGGVAPRSRRRGTAGSRTSNPSEAADGEPSGSDASQAEQQDAAEPQGIWGRFRAGRGDRD